ncbi:hypothetical protein BQ8794_50235 [Mesorhizobium prunaredense]|uniref:Pectate lyase superfamily protein domain-containing protein n=1 Tax=Mesorhizobium prunaredense TaxID=1631249 RepID=A0A1R3VE86_9HYPH|nr:hypothetical protein [Mesorhizobium prunaredense]SIT58133.1 hypothetical protein BQ8794_50235 [Mesorhizobium prunaredense]
MLKTPTTNRRLFLKTGAIAAFATGERIDGLSGASAAPVASGSGTVLPVSREVMKAIPILLAANAGTLILVEDATRRYNSCGIFHWTASDLSAMVSLDPSEGVYIASNASSDGSSGAWVRQFNGPVRGEWWRVVGDNTADDTPAIQAMIDFCLQRNDPVAALPPGRFKTTDTLHLGWGDTFRTIVLEGAYGSYAGTHAGSSIWPTRYDRPCINIAGGRRSGLRTLSIIGPAKAFVANLVSGSGKPYQYPASAASWNDVSNAPDGMALRAPFAGVTIDAYAEARPATHYPAVTYPAWTGLTGQYNKNAYTSEPFIHECRIEGFAVQIALGINTNAQGDFLSVIGCEINYGVIGISVNNTQSRNVHIERVNYTHLWTFLDNGSFGDGTGTLGGDVVDISGSHSYQTFNIPSNAYSQAITFRHIYSEAQVRIGLFGGGRRSGKPSQTREREILVW